MFYHSYCIFFLFSPVYETCKLGSHSPQCLGNQMEIDSGKGSSSSGFVLLDCPQSMKMESSNASLVGSISDYFLSLSNGWDLTSYLKSLSKVLKGLKLGPCLSTNSKEGSSGPCMVSAKYYLPSCCRLQCFYFFLFWLLWIDILILVMYYANYSNNSQSGALWIGSSI